jgi:AmmeMemoRadiSam system protein B
MRKMIAAGKFYEEDQNRLKAEIDSHYEGERGPGALPLVKPVRHTQAIIVPSSPYRNCGDCMAWAYKAIAESQRADVYIIIAAGKPSIALDAYQTPLEKVRIDQELAKAIAAKGTIVIDDIAHNNAHAIDVQLPFLQHAKLRELEHIKILPVLVDDSIDLHQLATDIKESLLELGRNAIYIVSTNLTQHGPLFHYVPFTVNVQQAIYDLDKGAIDCILRQDQEGFRSYHAEYVMNIAGASAIELLLRVLRKCKVTLEQYYTSGDVLGDYKNSVSYAAIVFEKL